MLPFARQGMDMLFPVSVMYSLNFIIEPKTVKTAKKKKIISNCVMISQKKKKKNFNPKKYPTVALTLIS